MTPNRKNKGFTFVELAIVMVIIGILATMSIPKVTSYVENTRNARAMVDIRSLETEITSYVAFNGDYPENLALIERDDFMDPWGNPYQYTKIANTEKKPKGLRKDRFLVPVNSDFDLYSKGADGETTAPFTAAKAHDDIVRANNGSFVGLAKNY